MVNELYLVRRLSAGRGRGAELVCHGSLAKHARDSGSRSSWPMRSTPARSSRRRCRRRSRATSPSVLGVYGCRAGGRTPDVLEFLGAARQWRVAARAAAARAAQRGAGDHVASIFGTEAIEYRLPTRDALRRDARHQGVSDADESSGCSTRCCRRRFPFVLTQSFAFLTKATGQGLLQRQYNRMANAGDFAVSPGGGAEGRARCADEQRVRDGRSSLLLQVLAEPRFAAGERARRASTAEAQ